MAKKIVAIIPARGGSKGIPKKNLLDLLGKPLLCHSIEQALGSKFDIDVFVSSDSKEILDVATECGANTIQRPVELSADESTSESAIVHFLQTLDPYVPDIVVFLQATSPLRSSDDIDKAIECFMDGNYDSLFSSVDLEDIFIWKNRNKLESINYDYKNRKRRQDIDPDYYIENGSIYIFKPDILLTNNNRLGGKIGTYVMDSSKLLEIDTYDDYLLCKSYMEMKNDKNEK